MNYKYLKYLISLCSILVCIDLNAQSVRQKKAQEFLRLSGLTDYTRQTDEIASAKVDEEFLFIENAPSELEIKAIIKLYLTNKNVNHHITEYIATQVNEDLLNKSILFLENPINEDIHGTRNRSLTRFEKIDKAKYVNNFDMHSVDQERFNLCVNIYQLLKIGRMSESVLYHTLVDVSLGINEHLPTDQKKVESEIISNTEGMFTDQYKQVMMTNQIANMMYVFTGTSDNTLRSYINKWHTYDGEKTLNIMQESINYAYAEILKEIKNHGS
ncbi:hypothetical protein KMW28_09485 [Flammeovirga yaeyamensis]|uniref:Uncharacterized protein n=1 Tax=Flammeovirga yaeyamensis TaxID=367791 RepID=A0AAX1N8E1_9BACT|nr:hypothetical protein [Flammeovirga yaeyamensis]MBB3698808.1 hypothetical protein [Flammeovirga yaeyamensis]NMF37393.1 hypothetical protein [Flammeovirga yaeyamensis]QWG03793.1 hypothetical protein KMW28_09485 [Flammeovirga yaeyamensis]